MRSIMAVALVALALLAEPGGCSSSGGSPNAPQAPAPGGGQAQEPQAPPNPVAADPGPHTDEIRRQVAENPKIAALVVLWDGERRFWVEWTTERGQVAKREEPRAQRADGGWWIKIIPVRPGQQIGVSGGPLDIRRQLQGVAICEIWHTGFDKLDAAYTTVGQGSCAASATIPGG